MSVSFVKSYHVQKPQLLCRKRTQMPNIKSSIMNCYSYNSNSLLFIECCESIQLLTNMKRVPELHINHRDRSCQISRGGEEVGDQQCPMISGVSSALG